MSGPFTTCASSTAQATLAHVDLVVMLDKSGSMGDGVNGDPAVKWNPVTAGLEAFFADPKSSGTSASLQFFPLFDECNSSAYFNPAVTMRALPDAVTFKQAIAATTPAGNTPTLPVENGAIDFAHQQQQMHPKDKVAIVLVTDGDPDSCMSTARGVSTAAAKAAMGTPPVQTFVIGIGAGASTANLTMIAAAGGTSMPTIVSTNNPAQTSADFQAALDQIRGRTLSCGFPLPPPPSGATIDFTKINVVYTSGDGTVTPLPYHQDCSGARSWRYDDAANPTAVILCQSTCDLISSDAGARIDIVYGCLTVIS